MLMVIFGAGASYDSCSSFPPESWPRHSVARHRPPLAKELFLQLSEFRQFSKLHGGRFQPLLPYLQEQENIEQILEEFRQKADRDLECRRQLWAIQYYIRDVIQNCQNHWIAHTHGASNYKTLLDQVRECPHVCFVTFNYDTLMEVALEGIDVPLNSIDHYVSHSQYSLIKLHGSINWQYWLPKAETSLLRNEQPNEQDLIRAAPVIGERAIIEIQGVEPPQAKVERFFFAPALAIPTASKHKFVCPEEHVRALKAIIPEVTKIVIVGWRAAEQNFVEMLANGLTKFVQIIASCGTLEAANETLNRLKAAGIDGDFQAMSGGFTNFVVDRSVKAFL